MCSSLLQLAPGSRDLFQAEKSKLFSLKVTFLLIQNNYDYHFVNLLSLNNSDCLLSLRYRLRDPAAN